VAKIRGKKDFDNLWHFGGQAVVAISSGCAEIRDDRKGHTDEKAHNSVSPLAVLTFCPNVKALSEGNHSLRVQHDARMRVF
jgi:hypothetical protein